MEKDNIRKDYPCCAPKDFNFDHKRQVTSFEHLMEDFNNDVDESDLTHLEEILSLHDLSLDPAAGTLEQFHQRSLDNVSNRCLHHHVFDDAVIGRVCDDLDMSVIEQSANKRNWIFLIDTKQ